MLPPEFDDGEEASFDESREWTPETQDLDIDSVLEEGGPPVNAELLVFCELDLLTCDVRKAVVALTNRYAAWFHQKEETYGRKQNWEWN